MKTPLTSTPAPPPAAAPPPALSAGAFAAASAALAASSASRSRGHDEDVVVLGADQRGVVDVADGVAVGDPDPVALPSHAVGHRHLALRPRGISGDVVDKADVGAALESRSLEFSSGRHRRNLAADAAGERHRRDGIESSGIG